MRPDFQGAVQQSTQARRLHMNHIVLILERTFDEKEFAACHYQPVTFVEIGCDDHVCDSCLVLHGDEDKAFGGARPLPSDDATGCTDKFAILASSQFICREDVISAEFCAAIMHRVFTDGQACVGVSAEGILRARAASTWSRIVAAEGIRRIFVLYSPIVPP